MGLSPFQALAEPGVIPLYPGHEPERLFTGMILIDGTQRDLSTTAARHELVRDFSNLPRNLPPPVALNAESDWQLAKVTNKADEQIKRLLDTNEPFRSSLDIWLIQKGIETLLLSARMPPRPPDERTVPERVLRSPMFELPPGESAFLLVHHLDDWSAKESLSLISRKTLEDRRASRSLWFGILVGTMLLLVLFFIVFAAVLRFWAALGYSLLFGVLLLSDFHYEGILFLTLYPDNPEILPTLSAGIALVIHNSLLLFLYLVLPLRLTHWPIHVVSALTVISSILALLIDGSTVDSISESVVYPAVFGLVCLSCLMLSIFSVHHRVPGAYLIVLGITLYLARPFIAALADLAIIDLSVSAANAIVIPALQVIDGFVFAALLVANALKLRDDRDAAREAEVAALHKQLELSAAQLSAEQQRDVARRTAEQHRERLQVASHDLRQPLTALRSSLGELQTKAPEVGSTLKASVDYLDSVLDSSLRATAPDPSEVAATHDTGEAVAVQTLFDNVGRMFQSEAAARGVELRCVPTQAVVIAQPIELIRMVSNLVSNAVKYSAGGRVVVGLRRRRGTYSIEVWDSGPGLTPAELTRVLKPHERGKNQTINGEGLGLDIVGRLALDAQLEFTASSWPGRGSVFRISRLTPCNLTTASCFN